MHQGVGSGHGSPFTARPCSAFNSFWPRTSNLPSTSASGARLSPGSRITALASGQNPAGLGSIRYGFVLPSVRHHAVGENRAASDERRLLIGLPLDLAVHAHRDESVAPPLIV